jgi:uroporphyrin-3 C-methyltransferase
VNIEKTELEATPSESGIKDDTIPRSRPDGPGNPSEPPAGKPGSKPSAGKPGSEPPPEKPGSGRPGSAPKKRGGFTGFLALLLALAALALSGWNWWAAQDGGQGETVMLSEFARLQAGDEELSLKITQLREQLDRLASGDVSAEFEALQRRLEADRAQMAEVERAMQEQLALSRSLQAATESVQGRLQAAEAAVSGLSTRELDAGGELDLAEVDYLLRLANERLRLFSDPAAADQALEVADMHLAALDNPMYLGVRQEIAAARRDLAEVSLPPYLEIGQRLDAVQAAIPSLTFAEDESEAAPSTSAEPAGDDWWSKTKDSFSSLVTVRRTTGGEGQRLSLEDKDFIRQRAWLQVEIAHLALMRRDQQAFHDALERVDETLEAWFAPGTEAFASVAAEVESLSSLQIEVEVPDITGPWSTLRLLRNTALPAPRGEPEAGTVESEAAAGKTPAAAGEPEVPEPVAEDGQG